MTSYARNSVLNLIFNYSNIAFNIVTNVLLVPFYLRKIALDAYGSYIVAVGISTLIGLLEFGLSMVLTERLSTSHAKGDQQAFSRTAREGLVAATLLLLLTCLVTFGFYTQIASLSKIEAAQIRDLEIAFLCLSAAAACNIFMNLGGSIFQAALKAGALGAINLVSAIAGVVVAVAAFTWHPGLVAIALAPLVRSLCATSLLLIGSIGILRLDAPADTYDRLHFPLQLLRACLPVFFGTTSRSLVENAQNLILAHALSPAAIAILALTQKALQVCSMVLAPIGSSLYASLIQVKQSADPARFSALLGVALRGHFLIAVLLISTAAQFNGAFMSLWVGEDKFGGTQLSVLLGISALLLSRFAFLGFLIYSTGDFRGPLKLEIGYSTTKIIALGLLVGPWRLYSVPVAEIMAGLVFLFFFGNRLLSSRLRDGASKRGIYHWGWIEFTVLNAVGFAFIQYARPHGNWAALALHASLFLCLSAVCLAMANRSFIRTIIFTRKAARN